MMTVTPGRPRHAIRSEDIQAREVVSMVVRSAYNRRKPPPVSLGTCRSDEAPRLVLGKGASR